MAQEQTHHIHSSRSHCVPIIDKILEKHDPVGIVFKDDTGMIENPQEYWPEARIIFERFNKDKSIEVFKDMVYQVFVEMFNFPEIYGTWENYEVVSTEIFNTLHGL